MCGTPPAPDADPPGCRALLDADPPLGADPSDADPQSCDLDACWEANPPYEQTDRCEKHYLCKLRLRAVINL